MGIKDVRRTRQGLAQAVEGVQQEQRGALLQGRAAAQDRERVRVLAAPGAGVFAATVGDGDRSGAAAATAG
mgnify:CR=1 FL=1